MPNLKLNPNLKLVAQCRQHLAGIGESLTKGNITTGSLVVLSDLRVIRAAVIDLISDLENIERETAGAIFFLRTELDRLENEQIRQQEGRPQ